MNPASWTAMVAEFGDETDLVNAIAAEVAKSFQRGTLICFAEFAVDVQAKGGRHELGFYAADDAPSWVTAPFGRRVLRAVHDVVARGLDCACMHHVVIVARDVEPN